MPKTVFSGTAIAATSTVSQNAWIGGRRRDRVPHRADAGLERPVEDEADRDEQQQRRGSASATTRSAMRARLSVMARPPALEQPMPTSTTSESSEQHDRHRGGADRVVGLDLLEDVDRRDLRVERHVARDQDDRAELPDRAGEGQRGARQDRRARGSAG